MNSKIRNGYVRWWSDPQNKIQHSRHLIGRSNWNYRHGWSHTPVYQSYQNMIMRCTVTTDKDYPAYGGRGIKVCKRWLKNVENFIADMGLPLKGYTLERKNVNGNYTPRNCCWVPRSEQYKNRRPHTKEAKKNAAKAVKQYWSKPSNRKFRSILFSKTINARWAKVKAAGCKTLQEYANRFTGEDAERILPSTY